MKKIMSHITKILLLFAVFFVYGNISDAEYDSKLEECYTANLQWNSRSITDYVCIDSQSKSEILDQIILDTLFSQVDDKIEDFLLQVEASVVESVENTTVIIDKISKKLWRDWEFHRELWEICNGGILKEKTSFYKSMPIGYAALGISDWLQDTWVCMSLVETKLDIASRVAFDIIKVNKWKYLADSRKSYQIEQRKKYNELLDLMRDIWWYCLRLAQGVSHWTPYPLQ